MKLLEVRDGYIKFSLEESLPVSSFVEIDSFDKNYIAQILQINKTDEEYIAYAKLIFLYDGTILDYDKTIPSLQAKIKEFSFDLVQKVFNYSNPVFIGKFRDEKTDVIIDKTSFDKKMMISVDSEKILNTIIDNFSKQFEKIIVIDTLGVIKSNRIVATKDFKIPLNTSSLQFIYEDCLNEATLDSKCLIKDIFRDLAEYSRTVPFLPFEVLKSIIDDMVEKQHIFKLLVLKNKLNKFDSLDYFAKTSAEVGSLDKILASKKSVIDLSNLDSSFQNRYFMNIYEKVEALESKPQVFVIASNLLDKRCLKKCLTSDVSATLITNSHFKYINDIKKMFSNFMIEPSFKNNETFKPYSKLLNSNLIDNFLIVGDCTKSIPILTSLCEYESFNNSNDEILLKENNFVQLEESLSLEEEKDSSVVAIDKKSDELIEKMAEEVALIEDTNGIDLFEDESDVESYVNNKERQISESELIKELTKDEFTKITDENNLIDAEEKSSTEEVNFVEELNNNSEELVIEPELEQEDELEEKVEVADLSMIDEVSFEQIDDEDIENNTENELVILENQNDDVVSLEEEFHTKVDDIQTIEIPEEMIDLAEEAEMLNLEENKETELVSEITEEELEEEKDLVLAQNDNSGNDLESSAEFIQESDIEKNSDMPDIIPISFEDDETTGFEELDPNEILDTDIIVEFDNDLDSDDLNREIVEDVDKVFTTIKEDNISDSDLDFIDELNNSVNGTVEELPEFSDSENNEDSFIEPLEEVNGVLYEEQENVDILEKRSSTTPIVPVYDAEIPKEDTVTSDYIEQGDSVVHTKYGNGVVEKMIKYGSKTLFSINFDNVGRRLLDPTLTEIKKA